MCLLFDTFIKQPSDRDGGNWREVSRKRIELNPCVHNGWKADIPKGYALAMSKPHPTSNKLERIVIECVSRASGVDASRISAQTDVVFGLGMGGDDGVDLISDVRRVTGTKLREYDFFKHFGPEAAFSMHSGEPLTVALVEAELGER